MKRLLLSTVAALALSVCTAHAQVQTPAFSAYPVRPYDGRRSPVDLSTRQTWMFRTRLREAAGQPPNFAGHYVVAEWGCGTDCAGGAIVDLDNGRVTWLPSAVGKAPRYAFRLSSRLLEVDGYPGEDAMTGPFPARYYVMRHDRLSLVASRTAPATKINPDRNTSAVNCDDPRNRATCNPPATEQQARATSNLCLPGQVCCTGIWVSPPPGPPYRIGHMQKVCGTLEQFQRCAQIACLQSQAVENPSTALAIYLSGRCIAAKLTAEKVKDAQIVNARNHAAALKAQQELRDMGVPESRLRCGETPSNWCGR